MHFFPSKFISSNRFLVFHQKKSHQICLSACERIPVMLKILHYDCWALMVPIYDLCEGCSQNSSTFFVAVEEVGLQTSWLYLQSSSHSCDCLYTLSPAFLPLKEAPYLVSFQGSSHLSHGVWKHFCFRIRRENLPQSSLNFLS